MTPRNHPPPPTGGYPEERNLISFFFNGYSLNYLFFFQELTVAAYSLYQDMVFTTLDVDEFSFWASNFVPKGYLTKYAHGRYDTRGLFWGPREIPLLICAL